MSIVGILIALVLIVFVCWLVQTYLPAPFKLPALLIIVLLAVIWVVSLLFPALTTARIR
jgi:hypothetical protein